jgi:hypothetical protein
MTIGASIILLATGAILAFAVDVRTRGLDLVTVGVILMVLGVVGLVAELVLWSDGRPRRRIDLVDPDHDLIARRRLRTILGEPLEPLEPFVERRTVTSTLRRDGPPY